MQVSACVEWLFAAEAVSIEERMLLASRAGFDQVEFWHWRNKDLAAIDRARQSSGLQISTFLAEPAVSLTDPSNHADFLEGLRQSVEVAHRLETPVLIAQAGNHIGGVDSDRQRDALASCLAKAADILENTGISLAVEPLNTVIDHPGYFLSSTTEALDIVERVGRPQIAILYDIYHSMVMGELTAEVLEGRTGLVAHLHIADSPGRNQPGSGQLDLRQAVSWLREQGFSGTLGLEFVPKGSTDEALGDIRSYFRHEDFDRLLPDR